MTLHAVRTINANEEITIAYTNIIDSQHGRKTSLEMIYGFRCWCSKCNLKSNKKDTSNAYRRKLKDWLSNSENGFVPWMKATTIGSDMVKSLEKVLNSIPAEGLESLRTPHMRLADDLARIYGALGDRSMFIQKLDDAIVVWRLDAGWSPEVSIRIECYERWKKDPKTFPLWAQRVPKKKSG
jgi:hypothetical protein